MEQTVREAPLGKLAAFAASLSWDGLPETVQQAAVYRALDLISVALGAVGDPLVERMKQALRAWIRKTGARGWPCWDSPWRKDGP